MRQPSVPATLDMSVSLLRSGLRGPVFAAGDPAYEEACRVFIGGDDLRPAAIVRPTNADEVARVVTFARDTGLDLAVRSGGHSLARHGVCDGGIVLDLSGMRALDVDVEGRTAWAQTGLTAGEYTAALGAHGLATGFGDTDSVGIGGLTLGGGVGYLARKHGLTIDSLLAAEMVTADGQVLYVDAEHHPDLFWAIRGGGGNFGVATRFKFRLHEVGTILGGMLMVPATPNTITSFVTEAQAAPEGLTTMADIMLAPPMPFIPADHHGKPVIIVRLCYAGTDDAGERAIAPLRALSTPVVDMVQPMSYADIYESAEHYDQPSVEIHTMFMDAIDHTTADTILEHVHASTATMASIELRVLGGAVGLVPPHATAFAHRDRPIMATVAAIYEQRKEQQAHKAWVCGFASALRNGDHGAYVNFLGEDDEARVRKAYPERTWDRLTAIKATYDPANLFRLNHNIPPRPA